MTYRRTLSDFSQALVREQLKSVCTSIPGHILDFDPETQLAQVQIGVQRVDINGVTFEPPPLINSPVLIPGGAKFFIEFEINPGDECLIIFSQRCIDGWNETGGIAVNPILRFHDFDDSITIPGVRSQPNVRSNFQNNGIRLRNEDGSNFIWLKNDGTAEITVDTLTINGNISHTGDQTTSGTIASNAVTAVTSVTAPQVAGTTNVTFGGVSGTGHVHGGVEPGSGTTGGPS